jgi:predicted glycosyltransferase
VRYPGYHELAYLHPERFSPDPEVVRAAQIDLRRPYFILRFVSWQASHDVGEKGFDLEKKRQLVKLLRRHGRVLISSESDLPSDLELYRFSAPAEQIHHFLAFATLLVGESATMASEAAVLGTPAFYIADTGRGYTDELETRYGLVHNYKLGEASLALEKIQELLNDEHLDSATKNKQKHMLSERIDVTAWLLGYIDQVVAETQSRAS